MSQILWDRLFAAIKAPFDSLVAPQSSFNLLFLALTFGFCAVIYVRHARRPLRLRTLRRFLLPRRIYLHASAKLDYKYYLVMTALRAGMLGRRQKWRKQHDKPALTVIHWRDFVFVNVSALTATKRFGSANYLRI